MTRSERRFLAAILDTDPEQSPQLEITFSSTSTGEAAMEVGTTNRRKVLEGFPLGELEDVLNKYPHVVIYRGRTLFIAAFPVRDIQAMQRRDEFRCSMGRAG